ncbi:MAG TPA: tRNA glutamyl-Q(34) synthetase GluQRS [Spongiibacteraceae bacterium]|nr:tRNA glutamyl-Q(34) synthetase GluQRS [Spongiibacteraceae bacterium]
MSAEHTTALGYPSAFGYIGRFAPSPTGPLHFGSLLGALASFLDARANGGRWLVRIEDIDPQREVAGAAHDILKCLRSHGLWWDGEVWYQSRRSEFYRAAIAQLLAANRAFYCVCSRSELADSGGIYAGRCRACTLAPSAPYAIRLRVDDCDIVFSDGIQGSIHQNMAREVGDFVLFRKESLAAYQLAVVIDDAAQGITHVVRGSDLLDSTARQIFLQQRLALNTPHYAHIPVIANRDGQKLSKQTLAPALETGAAPQNLLAALEFLNQPPPEGNARDSVEQILCWAVAHWQLANVPRRLSRSGADLPASCRRFA